MKTSIVSYPDRGPWGQSRYRGNMTGHLYRDLASHLKAQSFCDPMAGSGSGPHAVAELGIQAFGLDLNPDFPRLAHRAAQAGAVLRGGFNILRDNLADTIGTRVDLNLSHIPYESMVVYSGGQWGEAHPDDLSRCESTEDFLQKVQQALLNQREATRPGGIYGTIVGDWRRKGQYTSYQAEIIARMPDELRSVLIKVQNNHMSSRQSYGHMRFAPIEHEYVLLFERTSESFYVALANIANRQWKAAQGTWRAAVRQALTRLGGEATLKDIYAQLSDHPRAQTNPNWQAKIRQVLQLNDEFGRVGRGNWALNAA